MPDERPRIHFAPRSGWINDPLSPTWHDGVYHLFFQHVPGSTSWAPECRWGHATSPDLVTWTELPIALEPGDGDDGVWSGSLAVGDDGVARILYTSVQRRDLDDGRVRVATAEDDGWVRWRKGDVVAAPPAGATMFRDPFLLRDGDGWRMLVGGATADGDAVAYTSTSPDLVTWTDDGVAARRHGLLRDPMWVGAGWECPQLIEVDGAHVLVVSVWEPASIHHVAVAVGEWDGSRFRADRWQQLTRGDGSYAPAVFRDADGRPSIVFWLRGVGGDGWQGATSVPHTLHVVDGRVVTRPHPAAVAACTVFDDPEGPVALDGPTLVRAAGSVRLTPSDGVEVRLDLQPDALVVSRGDERLRLPRDGDDLQVLVDGPAVEVWHGATTAALGRP